MLIHRVMRHQKKEYLRLILEIYHQMKLIIMQRIINKMKKTPFIDENTGEYNLKYNMQNLTEDFWR